MDVSIAFLRAVNVGGKNSVKMSDIKGMMHALGFLNVRSLLQSGNIVFEGSLSTILAADERLEKAFEEMTGFRSDFMIRTSEELQRIVDGNPFAEEGRTDPSHLVVLFLKKEPAAEQIEGLRAAIKGREVIFGKGTELYMYYPDGVGDSKLTNGIIEKNLGSRGTGRNWNTILKLLQMTN